MPHIQSREGLPGITGAHVFRPKPEVLRDDENRWITAAKAPEAKK